MPRKKNEESAPSARPKTSSFLPKKEGVYKVEYTLNGIRQAWADGEYTKAGGFTVNGVPVPEEDIISWMTIDGSPI